MRKRLAHIFYLLACVPHRWPVWFHTACVAAGAWLSIEFFRGIPAAETVALGLLGGLIAVPVSYLCSVATRSARKRMLDEEIRRENQRNLTKFLEECIEREGGTPVWRKRKRK